MSNFQSAPKCIKLWIQTRKTNSILSDPNYYLNKRIVDEIKEITGLTITKKDIIQFPKELKKLQPFCNRIFRGVFLNDILLQQLNSTDEAIINRYYSFTKNFNWAKEFGNKIVLSLQCTRNYDLNKYFKEGEVILDKNIKVKVINRIPNYQNSSCLLIELEMR